ncbi:hypothetical protein LEMLEM_LOCUS8461, partial [Lemmus lemmus]
MVSMRQRQRDSERIGRGKQNSCTCLSADPTDPAMAALRMLATLEAKTGSRRLCSASTV